MNIATTALVSLVAIGSFSLAACSSPAQGDDVDTGAALSALRSPTGSFSKESGASAFAGYRAQRADSAKVSAPGAGGTSSGSMTGTRSIRLLSSAAASCGQGQACACPNGGTMTYTGESSTDGELVKVRFAACGFEDGYGFDGAAILLVSKKSLLGLASESSATPARPPSATGASSSSGGVQQAPSTDTATSSAASVLLAAKGTVSEQGGKKLPLEFALVTEAHYAFLAVSVPDGNIVIGMSDTGDAVVRSKEGTWRCHNGSSGWTCTSDRGDSIDVAEDASSATPPTAPSAPPSSSSAPSAPIAP